MKWLALIDFALALVGTMSVIAFAYSFGGYRGYCQGLKIGEALGKARRSEELRRVQEFVRKEIK
jgi:hypothetical protein